MEERNLPLTAFLPKNKASSISSLSLSNQLKQESDNKTNVMRIPECSRVDSGLFLPAQGDEDNHLIEEDDEMLFDQNLEEADLIDDIINDQEVEIMKEECKKELECELLI